MTMFSMIQCDACGHAVRTDELSDRWELALWTRSPSGGRDLCPACADARAVGAEHENAGGKQAE